MLKYIAYVAKDITEWRACYVIECGSLENAQSLISTMGKAFELRYKEYYGGDMYGDLKPKNHFLIFNFFSETIESFSPKA